MSEPYGGVKQIVIHPAAWDGVEKMLRDRGFGLALMPDFSDGEDLPTYAMWPLKLDKEGNKT